MHALIVIELGIVWRAGEVLAMAPWCQAEGSVGLDKTLSKGQEREFEAAGCPRLVEDVG
jgi:hypothetical protein